MPLHPRPRRLAYAALTVALTVLLAACAPDHPNSIFHNRTEFNREVGGLFDILIWAGSITFVFVEAVLLYALFRFRHRAGQRAPEQVHGNTTLEILWTIIPAAVLVVIAIPTVRTIFTTQAKARSDALQVEVIGHQWWWEFRYPQYNIVTANELYLPIGRTVNFTLKTQDVLHSFWIPSLGGKRDLIANRTNYMWFTPDSSTSTAWNGFCAEYCGLSHANMRFKTFTVSPENFEAWARHESSAAVFTSGTPVPPAAATQTAQALNPGQAADSARAGSQVNPSRNVAGAGQGPGATGRGPQVPSAGAPGVGVPNAPGQGPQPQVALAGFTTFPRDSIPAFAVPQTKTPAGLAFDESLQGDATRGAQLVSRGVGACIGCHTVKGNPMMVSPIGPNLTHVGSRSTIAAGLFPNDRKHLALWIKNARAMKPGVVMPTLGLNQYDPILKKNMTTGGLTDQQIADIVAYLQALK